MSERGTPITEDYVDDVGRFLLALIIVVLVLSTLIDSCQNSKIRTLQRRVGELESRAK